MLPLLIILGFGYLVWWLTRQIASFPHEFAPLLEDAKVRTTSRRLWIGRSEVVGRFHGRDVIVYFQRADEYQSGLVIVSVAAAVGGRADARIPLRSIVKDADLSLGDALHALEKTHRLKLEVEPGWLRATWRPFGLFIFPGRFDPEKWRDVLLRMRDVASRLESTSAERSAQWTDASSADSARVATVSEPSSPCEWTPIAQPDSSERTRHVVTEFATVKSRPQPHGVVRAIRLVALVMMIAGGSMLAASITVAFVTGPANGLLKAGSVFAAVVLLTAAATFALASSSSALLINETNAPANVGAMTLGGWLWMLLVTVVALPLWMAVRLSSLVTLWADMLQFFDDNDFWEMAQDTPQLSGVVLFPAIGLLAVPALELLTACGIVVCAAVLAVQLIARSSLFPRTFLLVVLLLMGLMASVQWAAYSVSAATTFLVSEFFSGPDDAAVVTAMARYDSILRTSANILTVVAVGFFVWTPTLFRSERVKATFGRSTIGTPG